MSTIQKKHLSVLQLRGIVALLTNRSVKDAADEIGVNIKTMRRWMRNPTFIATYEEKVLPLFASCMCWMQSKMQRALDVLVEQMNSKTNKPSDKLKAASVIISMAFKAQELTALHDALERYEELEAQLDRYIKNRPGGASS